MSGTQRQSRGQALVSAEAQENLAWGNLGDDEEGWKAHVFGASVFLPANCGTTANDVTHRHTHRDMHTHAASVSSCVSYRR